MEDCLVSREEPHCQDDDRTNPKARACSNCARLKMKCQWPAAGSARPEKMCSRCVRMKLPCHVPEAAPRKKRGKSTRVAQLEKKLDGLVSLLASSQQMQAKRPSPLTPESPKASHIHPPPVVETLDHRVCDANITDLSNDVSSDSAYLELLPGFRVTHDEASQHLYVYRHTMVPVFPFVPLLDGLSSRELYAQTPFLFWTIMSVVMPLPSTVQAEIKTWFRTYLAEHLVVQQERRLDMLQAIVIHLAWNDFPFYLEPQATPLLQLATSLVIDLRLDKAPGFCGIPHKSLLGEAWTLIGKSTSTCGLKTKVLHSPEEKRAVLGFYHISCLLSLLFRRGTQLPWSNWLAQCCDSLLEAPQYESDLFLVALIKMQHIAERAYTVLRSTDYQDQVSIVYRAPLEMAMNNARRELDNFVKTQPEVVKQNKIFWSHYHILLVRLYEPVLLMKAPSITDTDSLPAEPFQRAEALWKCVQCCSQFFEHQLTVPAGDLSAAPVTINGFTAFAIVTISRIMLLDPTADWEPALARRRLDMDKVLRRMSEHFEEADRVAQEMGRRRRIMDDGTSVFLKYSFKARWIRQWFNAKVPQEQQQQEQQPQQQLAPAAALPVTEATPDWATDFHFDENFWQELMSVYDCDFLDVSVTNAAPM